jgi:NitT/TauT family transport system permease protein
VSTGLAIIGAIVGEFMSGQGLGSVIDVAKTQYRTDLVFASILAATALGIFGFYMVELLKFILVGKWQASQK